jgi:hypothetical protein
VGVNSSTASLHEVCEAWEVAIVPYWAAALR